MTLVTEKEYDLLIDRSETATLSQKYCCKDSISEQTMLTEAKNKKTLLHVMKKRFMLL